MNREEIVEEHVTIESKSLRLRGILTYPAASEPQQAVLLCSPHPHFAGDINNNVIRSLGQGRVALINQWQMFSVGSGTKWIFNREVLERGLDGRPSHFGRLLQNTFRWLAQPSLASGTVGGYVTTPDRLLPYNQSDEVQEQYMDWLERQWDYDPSILGDVTIPSTYHLYRGLIGAKSAGCEATGQVSAPRL